MQEIRKLADVLKESQEQLTGCMRCGLCQSVCPLFAQTLNESDVARGKLCLTDGLAAELLNDVRSVRERLDNCLLCGSCAANCPSGVKVLEIFLNVRVILSAYQGLSPVGQLVLRWGLSHPRLFDRISEWFAACQSLFTRQADSFSGTSCFKLTSPLFGSRHFMPLADIPFHKKQPAKNTPPGQSGLKVAFYYGCLTDKIYPNIGEAVLNVSDYHGIGVFMPENQACCGIPALSSGDMRTFRELVRINLGLFGHGQFDALITPCATCTAVIKKFWTLFAGEFSTQEAEAIAAVAAKTTDVSAFISDRLGVKPGVGKKGGGRITYHDPCHLKKSLNISSQPRNLICCNDMYEFVEMNEAEYCCGSGGSFNLKHYDISAAIGNRKRGNIIASGAQVVATSCPACMMQITDMLSQRGDKIRVRHVIEIYSEALSAGFPAA